MKHRKTYDNSFFCFQCALFFLLRNPQDCLRIFVKKSWRWKEIHTITPEKRIASECLMCDAFVKSSGAFQTVLLRSDLQKKEKRRPNDYAVCIQANPICSTSSKTHPPAPPHTPQLGDICPPPSRAGMVLYLLLYANGRTYACL